MCATSEPCGDITGVGAILPVVVAVSRERFAAMRASVGVYGLSAHLMLMRVPPCLAASRGAELDAFPAGYLMDRFATAFASVD